MRLILVASVAAVLSLAASGGAPPKVVATITTGGAPCGAVAALGSVWVANDSGLLVRINPQTNRVSKRIRVGAGSCSLTAAFGSLWIANYKRGLISVLPRSGRVRRISVGAMPFDVLAAFDRIWVTAWEDGKLAVVNPRTLKVVSPHRRRATAGGPDRAKRRRLGRLRPGCDGDRARQPGDRPRRTRRCRRSSSRMVRRGYPRPLDPGKRRRPAALDPVTQRVLARMQVGRTLGQGATARDGTIWLPDKEQSVVYRIDPERERVLDSFPAGPGAYFVLRAFGSMWVASYAGDDVWRFSH